MIGVSSALCILARFLFNLHTGGIRGNHYYHEYLGYGLHVAIVVAKG